MIVLTGDLHGSIDAPKLRLLNEDKSFKNITYLIILGDFGLYWKYTDSLIGSTWLDYLSRQKYTTLFIDGNHENFDVLMDYSETVNFLGGVAGKFTNKIYHLRRGNIYTIEEKTFFTFGGATSIDKHLRTEGVSWWSEETPSLKEFSFALSNLKKHNNSVDYILTHDCPSKVFKNLCNDKSNEEDVDIVRVMLNKIEILVNCKQWFFGHHHLDIEIDDKFKSLYNGFYVIPN
jgi:hypothetical protein